MKYLIAFIYIMPIFARADVYIDHVTEKGKQYVVIEKNKTTIKVQVDPKDTEDEQVAKVCKMVRCNASN